MARSASKGKLNKILGGVIKSVVSGRSISDSYKLYGDDFPEIFINVTKAGEMSGTLVENLEDISQEMSREKELRDKVKSALAYPMIILVAAFMLGAGLSLWILPKITDLFKGLKVELPATTRFLLWFADMMKENGLWIILGAIIVVVGLITVLKMKSMRPITHWLVIKLPIFSKITHAVNRARFCRTLSILLRTGIPIDESLEITAGALGNYYYKRTVLKISKDVTVGTSFSSNLGKSNFFPGMIVRMAEVGETSSSLSETLGYAAKLYEDEVDLATKRLSVAIEPILLLLIGVVVAFLALSIITPIYSISSGLHT